MKKPIFFKVFSFWLTLLLLFLGASTALHATHIRAGDITAVRTGTFTYCFTITLYTDTAPGNADSPQLTVSFGDGSNLVAVPRTSFRNLPDEMFVGESLYEICHTFPSGGGFIVSFVEENRNAGVLNINNGASVNIPFSVQTFILIDASVGLNTTPVFTVPPIDGGCVGQAFEHNPGSFDEEGDSLAFRFAIPRQSPNQQVPNYISAADSSFGGVEEDNPNIPAGITIDERTGLIEWNSPGQAGEYNIAFVVEEWRNGVLIGEVVRDMQIIIGDCANRRPRLNVPPEQCVVANEDSTDNSNILAFEVTATDPDNDPMVITTSDTTLNNSGIYDPDNFRVPATFTFQPSPQSGTAVGQFRWETGCEHVREEPYIATFRVVDQPSDGPDLVDFEDVLIFVKGPRPQNVLAQPDGRAVDLSWDDYRLQCPGFTNDQFEDMEIIVWRRLGCVGDLICGQEPEMLGYEPLGTLPVDATSFRDPGPLAAGLSYSYVITVNYPEPRGGVSLASVEQCVILPIESPVITNVSVDETSPNGVIEVRWIFPPDLPADSSFYGYNIYRAEGLDGINFTQINTQPILDPTNGTGNPPDPEIFLSYLDNTANSSTSPDTEGLAYRYVVELLAGNDEASLDSLASSDPASSVRLSTTPAENSIILEWAYQVPWSNLTDLNRNVIGHIIHRRAENETDFQIIDTVIVGEPRYIDFGGSSGEECLDPDLNYAYFVTTVGSYFNETSVTPLDTALFNDSQIDTSSPEDNIPPDAPILSIQSADCDFLEDKPCPEPIDANRTIENVVFWEPVRGDNTCENIDFYKLFFRPPGQADFDFNNPVYEGPDTFFVHQDLPMVLDGQISQAGCYVLIAVDQSGNEGPLSNEVCQDNCLYYALPNIFTPNNDGSNELFRPCPSPLYAESAELEIYNRWGNKVYESDDDVELNWDGTNENGNELPSGVYFYSVKVRFISIDPQNVVQEFKGWVEIVRGSSNSFN